MGKRFSYLLSGLFTLIIISCQQEKFDDYNLPNLETVEHSIYSSILASKIDSLFKNHYEKGEYIGAGVSIVIGSRIAYEKAFGYRNTKKNQLVDRNSVFRIGSLSKSFTGVLSGVLNQQGIIGFNDKIQERIPSFQLVRDSFARVMELRHLLSHTGGFPYHSYTNLVEDNLSMKRIIPYFEKIKNIKKPGTLYSYQNAAFAVSGAYMASAAECSVAELYVHQLFEPLEMTASSVDYKSIRNSPNVALPHVRSKKGWSVKKLNKKYYKAIPAGGVNTSTADMSKFLELLLGNSPELLSEEQIKIMTTPQIRTKVSYRYYKKWPNFNDSYYGLGWRVHTFKDQVTQNLDTLIHHGGMVNGYRSEMAFHRAEKFAICVMFNSTTPFSRTVIPEIIELIRETRTGKSEK